MYEGLSSDADPSLNPAFNISFASFNFEWLTEESIDPPDASDGRGGDVQANVTVNVAEDPSIFSTDWYSLSGWNQNGTDISILPESMLRLFDNADTTTQVFRSDIDIPNTYALEFIPLLSLSEI